MKYIIITSLLFLSVLPNMSSAACVRDGNPGVRTDVLWKSGSTVIQSTSNSGGKGWHRYTGDVYPITAKISTGFKDWTRTLHKNDRYNVKGKAEFDAKLSGPGHGC